MITRILYKEEKDQYNRLINHPIQTWEWGDFQETQGHRVYRLGVFDKNKMVSAYSVSFHRLPKFDYSVGTILRGPDINQEIVDNVAKIAKEEKAIFVKMEPDVYQRIFEDQSKNRLLHSGYSFDNLVTSPKVAFYPYTYTVNLDRTQEELLSEMTPKTRYNIRLANRHGVTVSQETNEKGFATYLDLLFETTKRQGFYLHSRQYHSHLWSVLKKTDIPHIFLASYQGQTIAAFMLFNYKNKLYYPYGASLDLHRNVMAPNLLMWESIKFGQSLGCHTFDMWGSLGPDASPDQQGYGFHRFKQGYGGQLVQFVGTYDLVINRQAYQIYNTADLVRWKLLRLRAKIPFLR